VYQQHEPSTVGEITRFWRHIFGEERGLLQIWTGKHVNSEIPKRTILDNYYAYPSAADEAAKWALKMADQGREVYFCAHLLRRPPEGEKPQRIKKNAAPVRSLWGDLDGAPLPNGGLRPTAVIESSPGRHHTYWRLDSDIPPTLAEELNKRIAEEIGADPSGFDLSQLLRVPGTVNHKYPDCPRVEVVEIREESYSSRELHEILPKLEESEVIGPEEDEPPVVLGPEALKVWRGEKPKYREDNGKVDKSATLMKIGRALYDAGGNELVVVEGVRERDKALGYNKFSGNRDGGQKEYERIWEKLEKKRRNVRATFATERNKDRDSMTAMTANLDNLVDLPAPINFPLEALPPSTRKFVEEGAASIGCPVDFVGIAVLAALSAAIGDTRRIVLKKKWVESPAIYAMLIGPPGSKKTPATKLALDPVRERQISLKAEYDQQKEAYKDSLQEYKKTSKEGPTEIERPEKPIMPRTWVDDTTVERLAEILEENQRGVIVTKDELSGWLASMNQYKSGGKGSDRQFWLSAHDNTSTSVDRKSLEEPKIIPRPFVVLLGGIQPGRLPDFGKDYGDGLIERFTPVYPEPRVSGWVDDEVSDEAYTTYADTIKALYELKYAEHDGARFPSKVHMTDEAKKLFVDQYNKLSLAAQIPGFPQRLQPAWSKLEGRLARLALVISMTRRAELKNQGAILGAEHITEEDMQSAIMLLDYFKNHIRRLYTGLYSDNPVDRLAADLRDFLITKGGLWEGTASELYEALPSEHKPERPEDLAKTIRAIAKQSALLVLEDLQRTGTRRAFRLTLEVKL
jgi:hypothetical protein